MDNKKIGIIGTGNISEALIHGMITSGTFYGSDMIVNNRKNVSKIQYLKNTYHVMASDKKNLVQKSSTIILAVKPQDLFDVLIEISPWVDTTKIIISVAAGIEIRSIANVLGNEIPIIRVMPNTSAKVLLSATALARGRKVTNEHFHLAEKIFSCVGTVREISEEQMDVITALSGSGPAYVYAFLEAMIDGGRNLGLSREEATEFTIQTLKGAIEMVLATGHTPSELSSQICSPGGTTIAGLTVLKHLHFKEAVIEAIKAAALRSKELKRY